MGGRIRAKNRTLRLKFEIVKSRFLNMPFCGFFILQNLCTYYTHSTLAQIEGYEEKANAFEVTGVGTPLFRPV